MVPNADSVFADAMQLTVDERAQLMDRLQSSLDAEEDFASPQIAEAWKQEVRRRVEACRRGEVALLDADQVIDGLRRANRS